MTVQVLSDKGGRRGDWKVVKNGRTKSFHSKKSRALDKARKLRDNGERLRVQKTDGTFAKSSG